MRLKYSFFLVNGRSISLLPSFLRGTYLLLVILKVFSSNEYTNNCDSFKFSSREHFLIIFSLKSEKTEKIHYLVIFGRIGLQKNHQLVDHACKCFLKISSNCTTNVRYLSCCKVESRICSSCSAQFIEPDFTCTLCSQKEIQESTIGKKI